MKQALRLVVVTLLGVMPAYAGPADQATFFSNAPVLGEGTLLALAVLTGLAGIWLVNKRRKSPQ